ncbi:MAG: tRNA(His) guanylyltransferase Thg1 family protein [Methanocorpusculum sp.]|nr:tRNA(His) guanylyltransferase Thg1 family protein [Methanocorpusculum sp.]
MKDREIFSGLTTTIPFVLRLDGRSFHSLSRTYKKPYDEEFSDIFVKTAVSLMNDSGLSPCFAYTFSDEISFFVKTSVFDNRVEKLNSVGSAFAASAFTLFSKADAPLAFDSRIVPISDELFVDYLCWRQAEAWRNHINGYCQKLLTDEGLSATNAQRKLDGMNAAALHELAFSKGINLSETPSWQRRGICIYKGVIEREGFNPKTNEHVTVERNVAVVDKDVPLFKSPEGKAWVLDKIK